MQLSRIDLNLYVVFDTIFEEGNLSRAAKRLFLTQPAVSHSLGRLREYYDDPLFVRRGHRMEPTPLAQRIRPGVQAALQGLQDTLQTGSGFDPLQSQKKFVVGVRDNIESWMVPQLMGFLQQQAPQTQLASTQVPRRDMEVELSAGRLDLAFDVLLPVGPRIRHQPLIEASFCVVARQGNPLVGKRLTLGRYLKARHVVVSSRQSGPSVEDFELSRLGYRRQVAMRCQHMYVGLRTVAQTDLLLTVPGSVFDLIADIPGIKSWKIPVDLPPLAVHMYWHESADGDGANRWLRDCIHKQLAKPGKSN
ncbi:MAG: LysR family transcriptional regulator [Gammaproteobacteria bacterium]|nr:MAG: LysR family transcriptional regulator [Gammaproteobacteria bacterium]